MQLDSSQYSLARLCSRQFRLGTFDGRQCWLGCGLQCNEKWLEQFKIAQSNTATSLCDSRATRRHGDGTSAHILHLLNAALGLFVHDCLLPITLPHDNEAVVTWQAVVSSKRLRVPCLCLARRMTARTLESAIQT